MKKSIWILIIVVALGVGVLIGMAIKNREDTFDRSSKTTISKTSDREKKKENTKKEAKKENKNVEKKEPKKENKTKESVVIKDFKFDSYKGVWQYPKKSATPEYELILKSYGANELTFDLEMYRLTSFENVKATVKGNTATFDVKNDLDWKIKGTIQFKGDNVVLDIKDSSEKESLEPMTITFTGKSNKSIIQGVEY